MARVPLELVLVDKVSGPLKNANASANKFANTIKGTGGKLKNASKGTATLGKTAAASSAGVRTFGVALKAALGPIALFTTAIGALTAGFGIIKEQDFAEAKFATLGGNADALREKLQGVSSELSGQADVLELTKASYDVASAGFVKAAESAEILKAASLGATGGFTDINTVSGATVKVLNAYGLAAKDAGALVDGFAQTQADGIITIGEYSKNIGKVASTASALKVPIEQVNAVIAQSTGAGVQAETAFTGLNAALAQIAGGNVAKALGVEINATTLATDGLATTLEKIKDFDTGLLIKAFGREGYMALAPVLNDMEKFDKLLNNQANSQGKAAEAAFTAADTIQGQLKRLQTAFTNLFTGQSETGEFLKQTLKVTAVTVEALGASLNVVIGIVKGFLNVVKTIGTAMGFSLDTGVENAMKLEKAWRRVLTGFEYTSKFVAEAGNSIGRILIWTWEQIEGFRKAVAKTFNNIKKGIINAFQVAFTTALKGLKTAWNLIPAPIRRFITGKVEAAISWSTTNFEKIRDKATEILGDATEFFTPLQLQVANEIKIIHENITKTTDKAGQILKENLVTNENTNLTLDKQADKVKKVKEGYEDVAKVMRDEISGALKSLIKGTRSLGEALANIANRMGDMFLDMAISGIMGKIWPGRATGGPVRGGSPYVVGERGPELFVPGSSGRIVPNSQMGRSTGNIVVNVDASGSSVEGDEAESEQLGRLIGAAVQSELLRQTRPGGILNR